MLNPLRALSGLFAAEYLAFVARAVTAGVVAVAALAAYHSLTRSGSASVHGQPLTQGRLLHLGTADRVASGKVTWQNPATVQVFENYVLVHTAGMTVVLTRESVTALDLVPE